MTVEGGLKNFFTKTSAFGLFQSRKTGAQECGLIDLNDERAQLRCASVVMRVKASELGLDECLRQCLETLGGAEPGEAVCHQANRRPEFARMAAAHLRIDTVRANDEVGLAQVVKIFDSAPIGRIYADRGRPRLQQLQQRQPANGRKAETIDHHTLAAMHERDVVP